MSIFFIPSSDFGGNRRPSADYAHPAHGRLGVLGTSGPDPRERGRPRTRAEREASMEAFHAKRRKQAEERKAKETAARTEKEQINARAAKAIVDRDRASREAKNKAASARSTEMIGEARKKPVPERRVSPLDLLKQPVSTPSQAYNPTSSGVPSAYLNALDARAEARMPVAPKETPAPASTAPARVEEVPTAEYDKQYIDRNAFFKSREDMLKAAMNPSGRYTPTPRRLGAAAGPISNELALRGMKAEDREKVEGQARSLQNQALPYSVPAGLAQFYGVPGVDAVGNAISSGLGYVADTAAGVPDFIDRNFKDFLIDPRNNRLAPPRGLRPVQGPTMGAPYKNPLNPLYDLIDLGVDRARELGSEYYPSNLFGELGSAFGNAYDALEELPSNLNAGFQRRMGQ